MEKGDDFSGGAEVYTRGRVWSPDGKEIMTRKGKIARLPPAVREELNRRLHNGDLGNKVVDWLNGLAEVQEVIAREFDGRPVREQNLSEWKSGGYGDWLARQEILAQARELASDAGELDKASEGRLTDHLATVIAVRYATVLAGWNGEVTEEFRQKLRMLRDLSQSVVNLRREDHHGARLNLDREKV